MVDTPHNLSIKINWFFKKMYLFFNNGKCMNDNMVKLFYRDV